MDLETLKQEVAARTSAEFFELVTAWVTTHHDSPDGTLADLIRSGTAFAARHWGECLGVSLVGRITPTSALSVPIIPHRPSASSDSL